MRFITRGQPLTALPNPALWVGVTGPATPSAAELSMAQQWGVMLGSAARVVVASAHDPIGQAAQAGVLSVLTGYTLTVFATAPNDPGPLPFSEARYTQLAQAGSLLYPFTTPIRSDTHGIRRCQESDLLWGGWVAFLTVIQDKPWLNHGPQWAVRSARTRHIPVFRLNSQGMAYRNPPAAGVAVTWLLESALWGLVDTCTTNSRRCAETRQAI